MTYSARWKKVFHSWDAFLMPLPFSRVVIVYGEPIYVPATASPTVFQAKQHEVEASIDTSRKWRMPTLNRGDGETERLCMFCILYSSSVLALDCCRIFSGAACEVQRIIVISPSVLGMVLSLLPQSRLPVAAYGFTLLPWERYKGYSRLSPGSIPACLTFLLCCLCLHRPANT